MRLIFVMKNTAEKLSNNSKMKCMSALNCTWEMRKFEAETDCEKKLLAIGKRAREESVTGGNNIIRRDSRRLIKVN